MCVYYVFYFKSYSGYDNLDYLKCRSCFFSSIKKRSRIKAAEEGNTDYNYSQTNNLFLFIA